MSAPEQLKHAHPTPGYIAVAPIPEPEEPDAPCAVCGKVHPRGEHGGQHSVQVGPFVFGGGQGEPVRVVRGIVLEIGELPAEVEHAIPYPQGATVHFTSDRGTMIAGVLYMQANAPIAWDD